MSSGFLLDADEMDASFARAALYVQAPFVLMDHFIFGSGLASYATYSSGDVGYSQLYQQYGLDNVFGLLEGDCPFVSDTFFPELVQFGIVGIILFVYFFVWVYRKIKPKTLNPDAIQLYKIGLLIILFIVIESVAGSAFLQGAGIMVMILLGFIVRDVTSINEQELQTIQYKRE